MARLSIQRTPAAFGLDISPSGVKFVQLRQTSRGLVLEAAGNVPRLNRTDGELPDNPEERRKHLAFALKGHGLATSVVASLPESKTFIEIVSVKKDNSDPFDKRLLETLPEYLPLPVEESTYDYQRLSEDADQWQVLVGAAPRATADEYLSLLQSVGLTPLVLDIEAPAIVRAVTRSLGVVAGATAIIDLGFSHAALIFLDHGTIQFTMSMPIAGQQVTTEVAQALNMNTEQAEAAKRACSEHPDQCPTELKTIIDKTVAALAEKIREAETYYADHFNQAEALSRVYLCGGGAHLALLDSTLSTALQIPVEVADPWRGIKNTPTESPLSLTTALGLALRAIDASTSI